MTLGTYQSIFFSKISGDPERGPEGGPEIDPEMSLEVDPERGPEVDPERDPEGRSTFYTNLRSSELRNKYM